MLKNGDFVSHPESVYHVITKVGCTNPYPSILIGTKLNNNVFLCLGTHSVSIWDDLPLISMEDLYRLAIAIEHNYYTNYEDRPQIKQFITELMQWWILR